MQEEIQQKLFKFPAT